MAIIDVSAVRFIGSGLSRPECVVAHASGLLFAPDWTEPGGVSAIAPNGGVRRLLATRPGDGVDRPVRPNGIALEPGGTFLLAHLGEDRGGVYRLDAFGRCDVVVDRVDGEPMPPTNFVARDKKGRLWITVSTRKTPRADDYRAEADTGFVAVAEPGAREARVVADGLGYANECLLSPEGDTLLINETFGRRLTAFDISDAGGAGPTLGDKRTVATFGAGMFPDGLTLCEDGSVAVVSIVSNRVLLVRPNETGDGGGDVTIETLLEDRDVGFVETVEKAFRAGEMGRVHLDGNPSKRLRNISNLAFGGPDLKTAYLGSLLGGSIAVVDSPVAGAAPHHWDYDLGPLNV